ncbi:sugar efflux transporter [Vibrio hepatarius]|jgi:SET family sugar efflux transporter-like MFS transporter|uniref:MFS transporter n=1 Tax=Vibrio hepatarius TaxID=171383 RepID=A0A0M0I4D6_9VIBR|nr:sugar efflux transporter [Vibrio hepatarius]KOO08793.1 MFS transporter [Vibrio hepatarius]
MFKDKTALLFVLTAFVTGLCGAFFYPLSSLFIVEALGAEPMMLSVYMVIAIVSSVIVSQLIARQSDRNWQRKTILIVSLSCYLVTVMSFIFVRDYWTAVAVATVFGSVSGASFGQLFALGREYGDRYVKDSTTFLSTMRAGIAIAWVFGPPAAFMLKASYGFGAAFSVSAAVVSFAILVIIKYLPSSVVTKETKVGQSDQPVPMSGGISAMIVLYCVIVVCTFAANNLYITSMPLYLSQELKVDPSWLGLLFGAAAAFEIPVMLSAGKMAEKFGAIKVMTLGVAIGCVFYLVMMFNTSFSAMLVAQLLNGFYIGVCATLGMVVLQDMMRDRLGTASTLFSSMMNIAMLVASLSVGFVGELFNYYSTLYVSLVSSLIAFALLVLFSIKSSQAQSKPIEASSTAS